MRLHLSVLLSKLVVLEDPSSLIEGLLGICIVREIFLTELLSKDEISLTVGQLVRVLCSLQASSVEKIKGLFKLPTQKWESVSSNVHDLLKKEDLATEQQCKECYAQFTQGVNKECLVTI
jgi:hypothetical protein